MNSLVTQKEAAKTDKRGRKHISFSEKGPLEKTIFEAFLPETDVWLLELEFGPEVIRDGGQRQHK